MINIYQIDARKWTGARDEITDAAPCPAGWVRCEIEPQTIGAEFISRTLGWRVTEGRSADAHKAKLEAAYHALIAASICNLQSQTAWIAAVSFDEPCNLPKIAECQAWAKKAWAQYQVDKAAGLALPSFNEPQPPYSFLETMTPD
jgi:hypothetical protein